MPIKPENMHRYPDNWKQIRADILLRANYCCEDCNLKNHSIGIRDDNGTFIEHHPPGVLSFKEYKDLAKQCGLNLIRIVLTIAHLDHQPENNEPENLSAKCQRCHIIYDREHHKVNRLETLNKRAVNKKQFTIFT